MPENTPHHVAKISLSKLFGRYSFEIPRSGEKLSDLTILYGENGLGKTTLLNLIFHLLSPSKNKNHQALISATPFQLLTVTLNDGTVISAEKDEQLLSGPVKFRIQSNLEVTEWKYPPSSSVNIRVEDLPESINVSSLPKEYQEEVLQSLSQRRYFNKLSELEIVAFMLTSDRILLGDLVELSERERRPRPSEAISGRLRISEIVTEQRIASATQALANASAWMQKKFVERSYGAAESASKVYEKVVTRISNTRYRTSEGLSHTQQLKLRESLTHRINTLNEKSKQFFHFGLAQVSISPAVLENVKLSTGNKLHLIDNVLSPHLDELEARQKSVEPFYDLINGFVSNVNKFFRDKQITYSLRSGLRIFSNEAKPTEIIPSQLSSGEQQLVLIFCHVLTARDTPSLFIIDEPEISLNILWQRMLVSSLRELAEGSQTQFLFASHSMEILAKHRNRVVTLEDS